MLNTRPVNAFRYEWDRGAPRVCWPPRLRVIRWRWWRGDWPTCIDRKCITFKLRLGRHVYELELSWFANVRTPIATR